VTPITAIMISLSVASVGGNRGFGPPCPLIRSNVVPLESSRRNSSVVT